METVGRDDQRVGRSYVPADRVSAQACAAFEQATVVTVPREAVASEPTVITLTGSGAGRRVRPRGRRSWSRWPRPSVVLDHQGSAVYADNVEFLVGDGATLTVVSLQDWADDAVHVAQHHALLGRDATFRGFVVTLGGDLVRLSPTVAYAGPGGDAELHGLYFADAGQHLEHRLLVDHARPDCRSRVDLQGRAAGRRTRTRSGSATCSSGPRPRAPTPTSSTATCVLTDGARADSVPNLEILTGEVAGAGHASATGRFDDEQLFYLQARGIPSRTHAASSSGASSPSCSSKIEVAELRERVLARVEAELEEWT